MKYILLLILILIFIPSVHGLDDDFNDGNYNGWTVTSGTWSAADSFLKPTSGCNAVISTTRSITDSYFEFDLNKTYIGAAAPVVQFDWVVMGSKVHSLWFGTIGGFKYYSGNATAIPISDVYIPDNVHIEISFNSNRDQITVSSYDLNTSALVDTQTVPYLNLDDTDIKISSCYASGRWGGAFDNILTLDYIPVEVNGLFWSSNSGGTDHISTAYLNRTYYLHYSIFNFNSTNIYNVTFRKPDNSIFYNLSLGNISSGYAVWTIPSSIDTGLWGFNLTKNNAVLNSTTLTIQSFNNSYISGFVQDQDDNFIAGATVSTASYSTTTNGYGFYHLTNIPDNNYIVTASKYGYSSASQGVNVSGSPRTNINFVLNSSMTLPTPTDTTGLRDTPKISQTGYEIDFWTILFLIFCLMVIGFFAGHGDRR